MARPSDYTPELASEICAKLAEGQSLRTVCKEESMPCTSSVFNWFRKHPEFLEQYTRAKEESADAMAEEVLDIADDATNDWMSKNAGDDVAFSFNGEHVQRSRLRIETRKWLMAKMKPKKYGEKVMQEITGKDGGAIKVEEQPVSDRDLARRIAFILTKGTKADDSTSN